MKKQILTILAVAGISLGAFAQGSINQINNTGLFFTTGTGQANPATATTYYAGALTLNVYFSTTANAGEITAINADNGTSGGGAAATSLLAGDGFSDVATTTGAANSGNQISGFPSVVSLNSSFAPSTAGYYAFVFSEGSYSGVVAFGGGNYGGNPNATPTPGTPYSVNGNSALTTFADADNLDLTVSATPEPTTVALAGLGGLALLGLRRKK